MSGEEWLEFQEHQLLVRVLQEQTQTDTEGTLKAKPNSEITPDSLQNPSEPDATYHKKAGKNYCQHCLNRNKCKAKLQNKTAFVNVSSKNGGTCQIFERKGFRLTEICTMKEKNNLCKEIARIAWMKRFFEVNVITLDRSVYG